MQFTKQHTEMLSKFVFLPYESFLACVILRIKSRKGKLYESRSYCLGKN